MSLDAANTHGKLQGMSLLSVASSMERRVVLARQVLHGWGSAASLGRFFLHSIAYCQHILMEWAHFQTGL